MDRRRKISNHKPIRLVKRNETMTFLLAENVEQEGESERNVSV